MRRAVAITGMLFVLCPGVPLETGGKLAFQELDEARGFAPLGETRLVYSGPEDVEAQLLAALASEAAGWEDLAYEMMERGRQGALPGDLPLLEAVEGRLNEGMESAKSFLVQELLPGALRERLMVRP